MSEALKQAVFVQVIRYAASTQAVAAVALHAGWMLLALATWQHAAVDGSTIDVVTSGLIRAYAWLGGVDADGHGDLDNLLAVWGKVSLVVYALDALLRRVRGERPPMRVSRVALSSGAVALLGYGLALWPQSVAQGTLADVAMFIGVFSVVAALAAAWAVFARRMGDRLIQAMAAGASQPRVGVA